MRSPAARGRSSCPVVERLCTRVTHRMCQLVLHSLSLRCPLCLCVIINLLAVVLWSSHSTGHGDQLPFSARSTVPLSRAGMRSPHTSRKAMPEAHVRDARPVCPVLAAGLGSRCMAVRPSTAPLPCHRCRRCRSSHRCRHRGDGVHRGSCARVLIAAAAA